MLAKIHNKFHRFVMYLFLFIHISSSIFIFSHFFILLLLYANLLGGAEVKMMQDWLLPFSLYNNFWREPLQSF